jgi:hypothetical protein
MLLYKYGTPLYNGLRLNHHTKGRGFLKHRRSLPKIDVWAQQTTKAGLFLIKDGTRRSNILHDSATVC